MKYKISPIYEITKIYDIVEKREKIYTEKITSINQLRYNNKVKRQLQNAFNSIHKHR